MISEKSWNEFRNTGLLWLINNILHVFGWAIVIVTDNKTDEITSVYPARVKFRGFSEKNNDAGYTKVTQYLKNNIDELLKECETEESNN